MPRPIHSAWRSKMFHTDPSYCSDVHADADSTITNPMAHRAITTPRRALRVERVRRAGGGCRALAALWPSTSRRRGERSALPAGPG